EHLGVKQTAQIHGIQIRAHADVLVLRSQARRPKEFRAKAASGHDEPGTKATYAGAITGNRLEHGRHELFAKSSWQEAKPMSDLFDQVDTVSSEQFIGSLAAQQDRRAGLCFPPKGVRCMARAGGVG